MPSRIFDSLDVIDITSGYVSGPTPSGGTTAALVDTGFANFHIAGSGTHSDPIGSGASYSANYLRSGTVNFANFPSIPILALITKVRVRIECSASGNASAACSNEGLCAASISVIAGFAFVMEAPSPAVGAINAGGANSKSGAAADNIYDYSETPLTYDQLVSAHGSIGFPLIIDISASAQPSPGLNNANIDFGAYINNFQMEVTYVEGPYSWYVKTDKAPLGGQMADTVDDLLPVGDGSTPPDGYKQVTPVSQDAPVWIWWLIPNIPPTYIKSPIPPTPDATPVDGEPVCTNCRSLTLKEHDILVADASGIYVFTKGKRNDTYYDRSGVTIFNTEYKIVDPFAKTGFV